MKKEISEVIYSSDLEEISDCLEELVQREKTPISYNLKVASASIAALGYLRHLYKSSNPTDITNIPGMAIMLSLEAGIWGAGRLVYECYSQATKYHDASIGRNFTKAMKALHKEEEKSTHEEDKELRTAEEELLTYNTLIRENLDDTSQESIEQLDSYTERRQEIAERIELIKSQPPYRCITAIEYLKKLEEEVITEANKTSPNLEELDKNVLFCKYLREAIYEQFPNKDKILEHSNKLIEHYLDWREIQKNREFPGAAQLVTGLASGLLVTINAVSPIARSVGVSDSIKALTILGSIGGIGAAIASSLPNISSKDSYVETLKTSRNLAKGNITR